MTIEKIDVSKDDQSIKPSATVRITAGTPGMTENVFHLTLPLPPAYQTMLFQDIQQDLSRTAAELLRVAAHSVDPDR